MESPPVVVSDFLDYSFVHKVFKDTGHELVMDFVICSWTRNVHFNNEVFCEESHHVVG